jgi:hypothetical protein
MPIFCHIAAVPHILVLCDKKIVVNFFKTFSALCTALQHIEEETSAESKDVYANLDSDQVGQVRVQVLTFLPDSFEEC